MLIQLLTVSVIITIIHGQGLSVPLSLVTSYEGKSIGTGKNKGQCATGVQTVFHAQYKEWVLGLTSTWTQGKKVLGDTSIPIGTAIASFVNGKYDYTDGHAAIYVGQDSTGIQVYDQWAGKTGGWSQRTLRLKASKKPNANQADRFYVINSPSIDQYKLKHGATGSINTNQQKSTLVAPNSQKNVNEQVQPKTEGVGSKLMANLGRMKRGWKKRKKWFGKSDSKQSGPPRGPQSAHIGITDGYDVYDMREGDVVSGYDYDYGYGGNEVLDGRVMMEQVIVSMFGVLFFCCVCGVTCVICGGIGFVVGKRVRIGKEENEDYQQQ